MSFQDNILDISKLHVEGDFEAQVEQLLQQIRLTRTEVQDLDTLVRDVERTLGKPWPGCKVESFGSIVTGLGIRTSDIDCFMKLPQWAKIDKNTVHRAKSFLQSQPLIYSELLAIPMAKVPIVKFYHQPTGRHCDINFSSYAGVLNSRLLAYLLHVDRRALPLAVIVKYWSKVHNLTGTNLVPNYALTMLVVFYLQKLNILPSVHLLQQSVEQYIVDDWNAAFNSNLDFDSRENDLSLYQLLGGFFNYYSSFDFEHEIISTYLGRPLAKECFKKLDTVPEEYGVYKHNIKNGVCQPLRLNTKICVQDPFEHSRNCSVAVHQTLFDKLLTFIQTAAKIFHQEQSERCLRAILTQIDYKEVPKKNKRQPPQRTPTVHGKIFKRPRRKHNNFGQNINRNNIHAMYQQQNINRNNIHAMYHQQNINRNNIHAMYHQQNINRNNIHAMYQQYNQRWRGSQTMWIRF